MLTLWYTAIMRNIRPVIIYVLAVFLLWRGFRYVSAQELMAAFPFLIVGLLPLLPFAGVQKRVVGRVIGLSIRQTVKALGIATGSILILGSVTALWGNSFFIRMTPTSAMDLTFLFAGSLLFGLFFVLPKRQEGKKCGGVGGVFAFLGFACPVCNKILILLLGVAGTWTFVEPARPYLGMMGIVLLSIGVVSRLSSSSL